MREIRDDEGRPWRVALTVNTLLKIRDTVTHQVADDETGEIKTLPLDLADIAAVGNTLNVLKLNYTKIGEILWACCESQAEAKNVSREAFLDGLRGDALEAAAAAVEEELIDFFPKRHRELVSLMASKYDEIAVAQIQQATTQMAAVTADAALSGMPSGKPQASSDATQANGHSDSSRPRGTRGSKRTGGTPQTC